MIPHMQLRDPVRKAAVDAAIAAHRQALEDWHRSECELAEKAYAEAGIPIGSRVAVTSANGRKDQGILVRFESDGRPRIANIKKDGTATTIGIVYVPSFPSRFTLVEKAG